MKMVTSLFVIMAAVIKTESITKGLRRIEFAKNIPKIAAVLPSYDQCGLPSTINHWNRIVGGTETQLGDYPWMVAIFSNGNHICGGSLVSNKHVVTAAHCLEKSNLTVKLGIVDIHTTHEECSIKNIAIHKMYGSRNKYTSTVNDIGIILLQYPVIFSATVRPICLPPADIGLTEFGPAFPEHNLLHIAGFGNVQFDEQGPGRLRTAVVPTLSLFECKKKFANEPRVTIKRGIICAGTGRSDDPDSCKGDSGGPLMKILPSGKTFLIGVTSFGIGCSYNGFPGIYTRVSAHTNWIIQSMKNLR